VDVQPSRLTPSNVVIHQPPGGSGAGGSTAFILDFSELAEPALSYNPVTGMVEGIVEGDVARPDLLGLARELVEAGVVHVHAGYGCIIYPLQALGDSQRAEEARRYWEALAYKRSWQVVYSKVPLVYMSYASTGGLTFIALCNPENVATQVANGVYEPLLAIEVPVRLAPGRYALAATLTYDDADTKIVVNGTPLDYIALAFSGAWSGLTGNFSAVNDMLKANVTVAVVAPDGSVVARRSYFDVDDRLVATGRYTGPAQLDPVLVFNAPYEGVYKVVILAQPESNYTGQQYAEAAAIALTRLEIIPVEEKPYIIHFKVPEDTVAALYPDAVVTARGVMGTCSRAPVDMVSVWDGGAAASPSPLKLEDCSVPGDIVSDSGDVPVGEVRWLGFALPGYAVSVTGSNMYMLVKSPHFDPGYPRLCTESSLLGGRGYMAIAVTLGSVGPHVIYVGVYGSGSVTVSASPGVAVGYAPFSIHDSFSDNGELILYAYSAAPGGKVYIIIHQRDPSLAAPTTRVCISHVVVARPGAATRYVSAIVERIYPSPVEVMGRLLFNPLGFFSIVLGNPVETLTVGTEAGRFADAAVYAPANATVARAIVWTSDGREAGSEVVYVNGSPVAAFGVTWLGIWSQMYSRPVHAVTSYTNITVYGQFTLAPLDPVLTPTVEKTMVAYTGVEGEKTVWAPRGYPGPDLVAPTYNPIPVIIVP
jgi:hypothetical protein